MAAVKELKPLAALTAADQLVTGTAAVVSDGWITIAGFAPIAKGLRTAVRARIDIMGPPDSSGARAVIDTIWDGWARAAGQPSSAPNKRVYSGWAVRVVAATSSAFAPSANLVASVWIADHPTGEASYIFREPVAPVELGDVYLVGLGDPAAGAEYAAVVVGAQTVLRLEGLGGTFATSAVAGQRELTINNPNGGNNYQRQVQDGYVGPSASAIYLVGARRNNGTDKNASGQAQNTTSFALSDNLWMPGESVSFTTLNIDAGDNYGAGYLRTQIWAVIV